MQQEDVCSLTGFYWGLVHLHPSSLHVSLKINVTDCHRAPRKHVYGACEHISRDP